MSAAGTPLPGQPLPLRMLLDQAVTVSRRHFRTIFPTVAIPMALLSGCYPLAQGFLMQSMTGDGRPDPARLVPLVAAFAVAIAILIVAYVVGYGVLYIAAMDAAAGRPVSLRQAWQMAIRPRTWGTLLLTYGAFVAGLVCCILPGIYIGLLFSLVVPVLVEEGLAGTAALGRSAELIRYNPQKDIASDPRGKAFLIVFVGALMSYALALVVQLPFIVAQQVYVMRDAAGGRQDPATMMAVAAWFQVPGNMLGALVQVAVQLYTAVGLALLYLDIRGRKEGFDLEAGIARLEGGPSADAGPAS